MAIMKREGKKTIKVNERAKKYISRREKWKDRRRREIKAKRQGRKRKEN